MGGESTIEPRVYRVGVHIQIVVGAFFAWFVVLAVFIAVKKGDWNFFTAIIVIALAFRILLQILRLEIGPLGFKYRNLSGSREVAFAEVARAYFKVVHSDYAPQGAAAFWVERSNGSPVKVNLRIFPTEAAAVLFTALVEHGIRIEVPEVWSAQRIALEVRAAQSKLRE
jgi:hypothetical protein